MRLHIPTIAAIVASISAAPSFSQDVSPGMWEISLETRVETSPGFTPAPYQIKQCITAQDARDPGKLFGGLSNAGASDCTYLNKSYSGNTFHFTMQCGGSYGLKTTGNISFTATTMNGTMTAVGMVNKEKTEFTNKISARRLGDC